MAITETSEPGTKTRNLKYTYLYANNQRGDKFIDASNPDNHTVGVICEALDDGKPTGKTVVLDTRELKDREANLCKVFGAKTTSSNAVTGLKDPDKGDPDKILEAITNRWETIKDGEWREGREGGPRLQYVCDAVAAVLWPGKQVNEKQALAIKAQVVKDGTKAWLNKAEVAAEYYSQETKRMAELTKAKKAAAKATPSPELDALRASLAGGAH